MDSDNLLQWCRDLAKVYGEVDSMEADPDGGFFAYIVHGEVWPDLDPAKWHFVNETDGEIDTFDTWQELANQLSMD